MDTPAGNESQTRRDDRAMVRAYAKVNLALSVGPPQPPKGYHPICSLFAAIDLFDDVSLRPCGQLSSPETGGSLQVRWAVDAPRQSPIDWPPERDLAFRAMRRAVDAGVLAHPLEVELVKRIPTGGGLGGGSADAAAVLRAIAARREWHGPAVLRDGVDVRASLLAVAMQLGSDIAYFCDFDADIGSAPELSRPPRPAVVGGYGELVEPINVRAVQGTSDGVVLLFPPIGCPTGAVYGTFDGAGPVVLRPERVRALADQLAQGTLGGHELFNDLAEPAIVVQPSLRALQAEASQACGLPVHVTGSGSTMFVLVSGTGGTAQAVADSLQAVAERHGAGVLLSRLV